MEATSGRTRAGGAVRLAAAAAGLAAPPAILGVVIGNPLPTWPIDWANVVESTQAGLIPSSVWVNVLAVAAWLAWVLLIGTLTVEVVAVARNRPSAAGVPRWIRNLAQVLVAAAIALAGPGQHALAVGAGTATVTVAAAPVDSHHEEPSVRAQQLAEGRLVTVQEEDSWRGFAEQVLGDASLGPLLRTANVGRDVGGGHRVSESTAFVEPGWQLLIPAHLDSTPVLTNNSASTVADEDVADPDTWDVRKGDHFWGIAEATLADAWGRQPTDAEIVPFWRELVEANTDRLLPPGDPDLIYPGQQFTVPPPPADPDGREDERTAAPSSDSDESAQHSGADIPAVDAPPRPEADSVDRGGPSADSRWRAAIEGDDLHSTTPPEASTQGDGWRAAIEGRDAAVAEDPADRSEPEDDDEARTALGASAGLAAGVAATTLLAAGVVATIRWRRRTALQQRGPGMRLPTPLPEVDEEVARLDAAAATDRPLEDLTALLCSIPSDVHPVLVRASDHGEVTLFFDEQHPLPEPPTPWTLADDGTDGPVGWRASLGGMGVDRSFGLPLLVTLGRSGTSTLLANIATMGVLGVKGSPQEGRRRLRAMSLEVATSRISVPVEVAIAGDERLASLDRVRHIDDPTDEVELAMDEIEEGVVVDDRTPRLLVCHHNSAPPTIPADLTGMVGAVATGQDAGGQWVLLVEDEDTGRLQLPDGGTVQLALPDVDPEVIDDELTRIDQTPDVIAGDSEADVAAEKVDPSTNGHPAVRTARPTEPAWCEVRLLGPVEVSRDGKPLDGLPPRALEMLLYLVTHPGGVPKERLDNVMWAGRSTGGGTQRVTSALTKLRGTLGDGPDGSLLVPRRLGDEPIDLSSHVGCDLDRALAHLGLAEDLPGDLRAREVAAALELVRGEPFEGKAYSWATDIEQRAIVRLQDAAVEAARQLRDAGELEAADRVIEQGLRMLDPNGWLYLERAELERLRGHPEQPPRIFEHYRRKLADDADEIAGTVASPPPEIELAFRELMARA
jgi:nucleoid-associated protein YgaU